MYINHTPSAIRHTHNIHAFMCGFYLMYTVHAVMLHRMFIFCNVGFTLELFHSPLHHFPFYSTDLLTEYFRIRDSVMKMFHNSFWMNITLECFCFVSIIFFTFHVIWYWIGLFCVSKFVLFNNKLQLYIHLLKGCLMAVVSCRLFSITL